METIAWADGKVRVLDQTLLPRTQTFLEIGDYAGMIEAIKAMRVRGAPAIGVAGAYAVVLAARAIKAKERDGYLKELRRAAQEIAEARPTAVNLRWAVDRVMRVAEATSDVRAIPDALLAEAKRIQDEDLQANKRMGANGAALIPNGATVLTHCNAGALATAGYGTALGVLRAARDAGKSIQIIATETRPLLQGARLTTWELLQDGFQVTLITDSMAGHFLASGKIACAVVGADRIAMNGDVANKIGTYTIAVVAKENNVPFYVAAPVSTIDPKLASGAGIPIEERKPEEVTRFTGVQTAPEGVRVANPAFDVTPHRYVSAIITERGVARPPYTESLRRIVEGRS